MHEDMAMGATVPPPAGGLPPKLLFPRGGAR